VGRANTIAQWTFETSQPATAGPFAAEVGTGNASSVHSGTTTYSSPAGNGSAHSFSSNDWLAGDYYQFTTNTLGESGITLSWDQTSSSTGPAQFILQYGTDGTNFTDFSSGSLSDPYTVSTSVGWSSGSSTSLTHYSADLSSISGLNNQATVFFRLVNKVDASDARGTDRVDNFTINGVAAAPLPPAVYGGLSMLVLLGVRKGRAWGARG
jgi:hypothetical protein